jgi:hypothetical protein
MTTEQKNSETRLPGTSPAPTPSEHSNTSSLISLADFASLRRAAFAHLRNADPEKPIHMSEPLREIASLRSERA